MSDQLLRLTNSEMKMWRRCKRQWFLGYHERWGKVTPEFGRPLTLGNRVHKALELLYHDRLRVESAELDEVVHTTDIIQFLRDGIEKDVQEWPGQEDKIRKEGDLAIIMMEGYLQWLEEEGADQHMRVIQPEQGVEVKLHSGLPGVTLLSKIDVRVQDERDGSKWALEHKTAQSLDLAIPTLQIDTQLLTEHLVEFLTIFIEQGADAAITERADGVLYNMLKKVKRTASAKPPFYDRKEVRHNIEELRNHWRHVVAIAREILDAKRRLAEGETHQAVCYPNPTRDCNWDCPFFQVCPMMDDGSDWPAALDDLYEQVDPLDRYNADLRKEKE